MEDTDDPKVGDLGDCLKQYEHLQHLYLKGNDLRDIETISYLSHLLTVNASTNSIGSIRFLEPLAGSDKLQFLQVSLPFKSRNRFFYILSHSVSI